MSEFIDIDRMRLDGGTQPRAAIFDETVSEYVEGMSRGDAFPPVILFFDGADYWLADGFHRHAAALVVKRSALPADVRQGTQRDAILYSVGVNADHGRPRTNEDKRRAVMRLLDDAEWGCESANWIAAQCRVSQPFVSKLKSEIPQPHLQTFEDRPRTAHRGGTEYTINTANIGRRPADVRPDTPPPPRTASQIDPNWSNREAISDPIFSVIAAVDGLPTAEEAVLLFPHILTRSLSANDARRVAAWFAAFADAWALQYGEVHAAAE